MKSFGDEPCLMLSAAPPEEGTGLRHSEAELAPGSAGAEAPDLMPSEQPKGEMAAVLGAGAASSGEALLVQSGSRAMLPMPGRAPVACWWARLPAGPPNRGRNCCSASECLMREGQGRNFPDKLVMNYLKAVTF